MSYRTDPVYVYMNDDGELMIGSVVGDPGSLDEPPVRDEMDMTVSSKIIGQEKLPPGYVYIGSDGCGVNEFLPASGLGYHVKDADVDIDVDVDIYMLPLGPVAYEYFDVYEINVDKLSEATGKNIKGMLQMTDEEYEANQEHMVQHKAKYNQFVKERMEAEEAWADYMQKQEDFHRLLSEKGMEMSDEEIQAAADEADVDITGWFQDFEI